MKTKLIIGLIISLTPAWLFAQGAYKQPPKEILDVLNAPAIPATSVSPASDKIALLEPLRYPPISELAEPMLRLAGLRINPNTNAQHRQPYFVGVTLQAVEGGAKTKVALPAGAKIVSPQWSPDGKYLAAGNVTDKGVELWFIETATGKLTKVPNVYINTAFGGFGWEAPTTVSATLVPQGRGNAPAYRDIAPTEPNIQETAGRSGAVQTFQDLLRSPNDERLFEYYATSQPALIDVKGMVKNVGKPAIYDTFSPSPDGRYYLVTKIERPFSYLFPFSRFPKKVEVWDAKASVVATIASIPLQDSLVVQGVPTGPRSVGWIPTEPATLTWAEALDGGDPRTKAENRDKLMKLAAPFTSAATEMLKVQHRFQGRAFGERDGMMLFYDFDRDTRRRRIFMTDYRNPAERKMISDLNVSDRYNDIGNPVTRMLPNGNSVIRQFGDEIFLTGAGASPEGDRPFLRQMNLKTLKSTEIFRSGTDKFESVVALADENGARFFTRRESPTDPPNLYLRQVCPPDTNCLAVVDRKLTEFTDPAPQLRGITKELVRYKRADGVDLSFTLYLPPGYKKGERLPTVLWAYPLEFTDSSVAGQVSGSTNRFTQIGGYSHLFFLLQGYAVLDDATMPIVGDPEKVNDTFVKQIVDSAKAAIDKGVEMGVVDRERVGVGGHSYGAFMTANLLAHSDLFRAGIARSGAYNRTLTPFGFQSERRTFWEAPDLYSKVSPFFYADKINEPVLLIHGEADNNQGTFPIQSERLFAAIRGNGGTSRLVMLPLESHGYAARESIEHTLFEQVNWFDKHVKNAKPR
ncbi:MAG: prolyl oligopeptidase family serine peptidase [Pyrinomonadaceae bacterium]|nr:prolyl oligopeptidase family serine peptidase [Pyrinomonadaceae bacterium]